MGYTMVYPSFVNLIQEKDDTPTDYREFEVLTWSQRLKESQDETLGDGHAMAGFQISHVWTASLPTQVQDHRAIGVLLPTILGDFHSYGVPQ